MNEGVFGFPGRAQSGAVVVGRAYAEYTTWATLGVAIPQDDTVPQITEGTQILSATITPKSLLNRLRYRFVGLVGQNAINWVTAAAFLNANANAINVTTAYQATDVVCWPYTLEGEIAVSALAPQTFSIRVGAASLSASINGSGSTRFFGGAARATLVVEEIAP